MIVKKFTLDGVQQQGFGMDEANKQLEGCTHVETFTKSNSSCGEDRTLVIFAFYPDPEIKEPV